MPKLTMNFIKTKIVPPTKGQVDFYRDDELTGFGLRVRESSMTYFVEKRVNGKNRRVTIGKHPLWTPDAARNEALVILGKMASGQDPVKEKSKKQVLSLTLRQAFEEFMESKEFRPLTRYNYPRPPAARSG